MLLGVVGVGEMARRFEHDLCSHRFPGKFRRISFGEDLESLVVHADAVRAGRDLVRQIAQNRIIFEQVGERLRIGEIVDRHEFDIGILERGAQNIAPDASETVNAYFNSHLASVMMMKIQPKRMRGREHKMLTGKGEGSKWRKAATCCLAKEE